MAEQQREPEVIESEPVPDGEIEGEQRQKHRPTVARPDVPATGRTVANLMRGGRVIS